MLFWPAHEVDAFFWPKHHDYPTLAVSAASKTQRLAAPFLSVRPNLTLAFGHTKRGPEHLDVMKKGKLMLPPIRPLRLPDLDSNQDKQNQNLSYYHYTIRQFPNTFYRFGSAKIAAVCFTSKSFLPPPVFKYWFFRKQHPPAIHSCPHLPGLSAAEFY